ncbi:MAG TPA: protein-disulfide reductase DsbD domain-containing protein [Pseudomonadales bacterium]|nr:protein-disulfide reductase DsbD domain-containing protein [Pseudomonadales bacterium]
MRRIAVLLAIVFCLALTARAAHTQATLVLSDDTAKPGDTVWAGVDLKMDPGWHTYWKNSGTAGLPTTVSWKLPPGVTAGDIEWPLPEKIPPIEVTTYGYNDEVMLLVPLKIGTNVPPGPITLTANLTWLECKDVCIPAKQTVEATLNIGKETKPSSNAAAIESWKGKVPKTLPNLFAYAWWYSATTNDTRNLIIQIRLPKPNGADFFPDSYDNFDIQAKTEFHFDEYSDSIIISKVVKKFSGDWPKEISGVIVITTNNQTSGFSVQLPVADEAEAAPGKTVSASETDTTHTTNESIPNSTGQTAPSLALMLLYAFIGGLILNVMPCVLPVIALKILGFVSEARSEPRRVRNLGFIYALGVLASFSVLAILVIGINAAGRRAGWGMQFGNPVFVVCMTTLITLVALNLFGVFEVVPGAKVMDAAGNLASRHGALGAFFNGLLATILATPCTAPYMATALGFAFSQSAIIIFLILLFVGLGLAAPYVLLSCNPTLLKFLPKPGPWMEKFKIAMGFPMLATVVWLISIASGEYGARAIWLSVFLVVLAFAAWIFGEFVQRGHKAKGLAIAIVLILLVCDYAYALEGRLRWREMVTDNESTASLSASGVTWKPWSPEAITEARAAGKPVLVDFTATWCVTCNAIVKPALETSAVVDKLKALDATTLLGDYTRTPQNMTDEIAKYGSAGVPLVLIYPKNPNAPAIVLRQPGPLELPSSYSRAVLDALEKAGD